MLLDLRLPQFERGVETVRVVQWLIEPGSAFEPGDDVVVIDTEPRLKLDVPRNAKLLSNLASVTPATGTRKVNIRVRLRLTAVERGTLRRVALPEGALCNVGDILGLVSTDPAEALDGQALRNIRVVVNEEIGR
jgi:pyruvate/2-oxoglutarate dehydrogenase complex dihydrolipoamide acyltransferase (E2) component